ncbi:unnamed protein product, partial [Linum tenue]
EDRDIAIFVQVHLPEFVDFGHDIRGFIHNLGWDSLLVDPPSLVCPELVRFFFCNLRSYGLSSRCFLSSCSVILLPFLLLILDKS